MTKIKQNIAQAVGIIGAATSLALFATHPSFPTPDKIFIFLLFVFLALKQAIEMTKRLLPFIAILLVYESFRSVADKINTHVNYTLAPNMDKLIFGNLPTVTLQNWLWRGHTSWYDYALYLPYLLHFVLPIGLAILVWKTRAKYYWQVITTYLLVSFAGFLTFFLLPAAPPWLASQGNYIQPVERISSDVWAGLGIKNFPSFYNHISPNPVAAIPSLHAAWATLLVIFIYKFYGRKWAAVALIYPLTIYLGTVYEAEHYAFDAILGIIYAAAAYFAAPYVIRKAKNIVLKFSSANFKLQTPNSKLQRISKKTKNKGFGWFKF